MPDFLYAKHYAKSGISFFKPKELGLFFVGIELLLDPLLILNINYGTTVKQKLMAYRSQRLRRTKISKFFSCGEPFPSRRVRLLIYSTNK